MTQQPRLTRIARTLLVEPGVAPGASLAIARRSAGQWRLELGAAGSLDRRQLAPATTTTPYDLASVTKPIFALALARLAARGVVDLGNALGSYLPEAAGTPSADTPLELFLAHRSGLEAHLGLFAPLCAGAPFDRRRALGAACAARRKGALGPAPESGHAPVYSDLGYLLLGVVAERATGKPLDQVIAEEVTTPLGLPLWSARQAWAHQRHFATEVAPTELVPWRGGVVTAVVHDENAWALAGHGSAGHAGLFGTADAVARFGCAVLDVLAGRASDYLAREHVDRLVRVRPGSTLRAGFDGVSGPDSAAGAVGPRSFGHLGFTGTSVWCDPDAETVTVVLTNRVHPTRDHISIRRARPLVQNALLGLPGGGG